MISDPWQEWGEAYEVTLVGGPFSGNKRLEVGVAGHGPSVSAMMPFHGTFEKPMHSYYASPKWDEEGGRWFRAHLWTRPVPEESPGPEEG